MVYVFFFKQMTAYEMRISDWSSDVCSSDLPGQKKDERAEEVDERLTARRQVGIENVDPDVPTVLEGVPRPEREHQRVAPDVEFLEPYEADRHRIAQHHHRGADEQIGRAHV